MIQMYRLMWDSNQILQYGLLVSQIVAELVTSQCPLQEWLPVYNQLSGPIDSPNIILGFCINLFPGEINIEISRLSKMNYLAPKCMHPILLNLKKTKWQPISADTLFFLALELNLKISSLYLLKLQRGRYLFWISGVWTWTGTVCWLFY